MIDAEARKILTEARHFYVEPAVLKAALDHALVALADRASLVEASWSTGLPDGVLLRIDAARRHMEGK
jgi:hypothetical protein